MYCKYCWPVKHQVFADLFCFEHRDNCFNLRDLCPLLTVLYWLETQYTGLVSNDTVLYSLVYFTNMLQWWQAFLFYWIKSTVQAVYQGTVSIILCSFFPRWIFCLKQVFSFCPVSYDQKTTIFVWFMLLKLWQEDFVDILHWWETTASTSAGFPALSTFFGSNVISKGRPSG